MSATLLFAALLAASPLAAREGDAAPLLIPAEYDLGDARFDDPARWLLPEISDGDHRPPPPRLRIRGRKVKLRVPFG